MAANSAAQIVPAVAAPLITRMYDPRQFGIMAVVLAAFGILAPIACLRYDIAIVLPKREEEAAQIAALSLAIPTGLAAVLVMLLVVAQHLALHHRIQLAVPSLLEMLPAGIFLLGFQLTAHAWSLRVHRFRLVALATFFQALVTIVVQLILGRILAPTVSILVVGSLCGYAVAVLIYAPLLMRTVVPALRTHATAAGIVAALRQYRRFPLITGPYAFLGQFFVRGAFFVIGIWMPPGIVGQYALAQRVAFLPVSTASSALGQVFYSRASRRLDEPIVSHVVHTILRVSPWIIGPFFLLLAFFGTHLFGFVFGARWIPAGRFAAILAAASLLKTSTSWLDRIFDIRSRQHIALALEITFAALALTAMDVVLGRTHDANAAVAAYAIGVGVFFLVWTAVVLKVAHFKSRIIFDYLASTVCMGATMTFAYALLHWLRAPLDDQVVLTTLLAVTLCILGFRQLSARMAATA